MSYGAILIIIIIIIIMIIIIMIIIIIIVIVIMCIYNAPAGAPGAYNRHKKPQKNYKTGQ